MPTGLILALCLSLLLAAPARAAEVPPELVPWQDWVLHGEEERLCPPAWNNGTDHRCTWPTSLSLDLDQRGGTFRFNVRLYAGSWVSLPGDRRIWPQDVRGNQTPARVAERGGVPAVYLDAGDYVIRGAFLWERLPESLPVPADSGLVRLVLDRTPVPIPDLRAGRLWLVGDGEGGESSGDSLDLQVYRLLDDTIPFRVVTRLEIDVAGQQREVLVGPVLPAQPDQAMFVPVRLTSPLTARLENDGRLRLQVRPGHWRVEVESRSVTPVTRLPVPDPDDPWPADEIWAFNAHTDLRMVEPAGLAAVDPRQTTLPGDWRHLPAFVARPGQELELAVVRRGDPDPAPDRIAIRREIWLDFDGAGYTVEDRIAGTMSRKHRLEAGPGLDLGRVVLSGEEMLITTLPESDTPGVEVRRGQVDVVAASRIEKTVGRFPASGWNHDFASASARLNIPPGWDVAAVTGVDNRPRTWLQRWSLLDLFLLLIISIAAYRLLGRAAGAVAFLTLALSWHAPFAPATTWLHILIATALVRYLPEGRFRRISTWYRRAALAFLILLFIPFAVDQVRTALYPQLRPAGAAGLFTPPGPAARLDYDRYGQEPALPESAMEEVDGMKPAEAADQEDQLAQVEPKGRDSRSTIFSLPSNVMLQQIDEKALVQTGPGLPSWSWDSIDLSWSGPLLSGQKVHVYYVPPLLNSLVRITRVLLVALLGLTLAGIRVTWPGRWAAAAAFLAVLVMAASPARAAQFPPQPMLDELEKRLLEPPDCMPDCAQVSRLQLEADSATLRLRLEIHALADVAVPLPGDTLHWEPETVLIDGRAAAALSRRGGSELWVLLDAGVHQVALEGRLPGRSTVQLPLRLPVHRVDARLRDWILEGVHEDGVPDAQLQLTRVRKEQPEAAEGSGLAADALPPFVLVERTLLLGLEWRSETRIQRLSPAGSAVVLEVPLLPGESVVTDGVRVQDRKVLVNMGPNQSVMSWTSSLERTSEIVLRAPDTTGWVEAWQADVSPIWHLIQTGGIAVVHRQDPRGVWSPRWRPWPGEEVRLSVLRPAGAGGSTFTIDRSQYDLKPGKLATDSVLTFRARSSLGGQHVVTLPEGAELTSVTIDGLLQPVRPEGNALTLPIHPGVQTCTVAWRKDAGVKGLYSPSPVDLGTPSANGHLTVTMPRNRWVLLTGGPRLGPAVLFWSVLAVVLLVAAGLARTGIAPLRWWQWALLGVGLTQVPLGISVLIIGWLLALGLRRRVQEDLAPTWFNAMQVALGLLTVLASLALMAAVQKGLLGMPEMQVMGNGSTAYHLKWYADQPGTTTAPVWVLSVPMFVYRALMLAWALWLASSLISWIKWGWESVSTGGFWRKQEKAPAGGPADQPGTGAAPEEFEIIEE